MTFRVKVHGQVGVLEFEQAGEDVTVRLNGDGVLTFQANGNNVPHLRVAVPMLREHGIEVRLEEAEG